MILINRKEAALLREAMKMLSNSMAGDPRPLIAHMQQHRNNKLISSYELDQMIVAANEMIVNQPPNKHNRALCESIDEALNKKSAQVLFDHPCAADALMLMVRCATGQFDYFRDILNTFTENDYMLRVEKTLRACEENTKRSIRSDGVDEKYQKAFDLSKKIHNARKNNERPRVSLGSFSANP